MNDVNKRNYTFQAFHKTFGFKKKEVIKDSEHNRVDRYVMMKENSEITQKGRDLIIEEACNSSAILEDAFFEKNLLLKFNI